MNIAASDVKALRDKTGAGMMDCKKALIESEGDMEKAIEFLRKKGAATAEKRSDRSANEGVVITDIAGGKGVIIEVNCETDFVARSVDFLTFAKNTLEAVKTSAPPDVPSLLEISSNGRTVSDQLTEAIGKIGEKIEVKRFAIFSDDGILIDYIHPGNKLGVMVELKAGTANDEIRQLGRDIAMQIAAMNPISIDRGSVPQSVQEKELEIYRQQAKDQGKPDNILDKIAEGKLNKFFQDFTLLEQSFIRDNTKTVKEHIADVSKSVGADVSVARFERFQVGDSN